MEEPILASNTANSARVAMILALVIIIKEIADQAGVSSESYPAVLAVCLHLLSCFALCTNELSHIFPIERMIFLVVMTIAAHINFSAAWTLYIIIIIHIKLSESRRKKQKKKNIIYVSETATI
jgi:chromate transport protein ChrA